MFYENVTLADSEVFFNLKLNWQLTGLLDIENLVKPGNFAAEAKNFLCQPKNFTIFLCTWTFYRCKSELLLLSSKIVYFFNFKTLRPEAFSWDIMPEQKLIRYGKVREFYFHKFWKVMEKSENLKIEETFSSCLR